MIEANHKHPKSLVVFFTTELWERYGFYVVQTLLALYMAFYFKWADKDVYTLVSTFTAITYLSPIIGGWIADNLLGQKITILSGAAILFCSYVSLSLISTNTGLVVSLAAIAVGTGLLKPNISSLLGNEYHEDSPKRESGFIIFYMGITTGIILGSVLPSFIKEYFGWSSAFFSAAIGMIISALVFSYGIKRYAISDYHPFKHDLNKIIKALLLIVFLWAISFYILYNPRFADLSFGLVVLLAVSYLFTTIQREQSQQRQQTIVIGLLCLISSIFWAFYFQMFTSLTLFISRVVEPELWGIPFPAPYYVAVQSLGMLIFGFFISRAKPKANKIQAGVRTGNKFLLSMCFMVLAYVIIVFASSSNNAALLSPLLLIVAYLVISISELLLSPVGLAAITQLASRQKVSTMMGIFFVSLGLGGFLSGKLAYLTAIDPEHLSIIAMKLHYRNSFMNLLIILIVATVLCVGLNAIIKKLLPRNK